MEVFTFPHVPPSKSSAYFALFRNVENAAILRQRIVRAATLQGRQGQLERDAVNFAFVDARVITSRLHLQTAIHQAILADTSTPSGLRTHSVHSEILFYLNPTNNITESFKNYGLSDTSTDLIVVRIGEPQHHSTTIASIQEQMKDVVIGDIVPFSELEAVTDWERVKRLFKLNSEPAVKELSGKGGGGGQAVEREKAEKVVVDRIVTSSVAMKSVMQ